MRCICKCWLGCDAYVDHERVSYSYGEIKRGMLAPHAECLHTLELKRLSIMAVVDI